VVLKPLILALMLAGNHAGELSLFSPLDHRIHGAAIYGVPWIPSIYPSHVSIFLPAPWILWVGWLMKKIRGFFRKPLNNR